MTLHLAWVRYSGTSISYMATHHYLYAKRLSTAKAITWRVHFDMVLHAGINKIKSTPATTPLQLPRRFWLECSTHTHLPTTTTVGTRDGVQFVTC